MLASPPANIVLQEPYDSSAAMQTHLVAIRNLFDRLNEQGIEYCHWKSNRNLDRALSGLTDLDLLVERSQSQHFKEILHQCGCKPIVSPPGKQYPAIEDYLGYDTDSGRLFHLHVHYQLILGEQFVKNYRLPLERKFLESARISHGVKIVSPELEVIVLAIRALLKYRDSDVVKDVLSILSPGLPHHIRQELEYLLRQTTFEHIAAVLKEEVKFVSPGIVLGFLKAASESPRSGYKFYQMRRDLRRDLAAFRRYSHWRAMGKYFQASLSGYLPFGRSFPAKKKPASGGVLIALVGADGAGKSTLISELRHWLSWKLEVQVCYMGSGERLSRLSRVFRLNSRVFARLHRACGALVGEKNALCRASGRMHRLTQALYELSIAVTRYRRYLAGRRRAAQGAIVVCDRYPLQSIHRVMGDMHPPMDGPRIAWMCQGEEIKGITAHLSKKEQAIYQHIDPPDYMVVLHVSPDVSLGRKPEHTPQEIAPKIEAIERMSRGGLQIIDIDADQPLQRTLLQVKEAVWNIL